MEHKRRSLSAVLDDDFSIDEEIDYKTTKRIRRTSSMSLDEEMEEYSEFMYNGAFNICNFFCRGIKNLICYCFRNNYEHKLARNVHDYEQ
jgi:hypothetical protein